ncbi:P-loop containing nucleoside triphosphate hydrolase protein [Pseudovirgaria hyperparasitica]|uniref:P-loop containing nucleoside triphosphate hydrolase protein n=1 Tax=Pseudovirgaria hyperparasitica TaxID=470096 RepID=A0A6A6VVP1_9PEZI|nr:P-loop containing nucleoside triphosphate hydrolase protein [Pseudovirgaria hyperparasitica]KAF2753311.1 P-loop containing nucleoside triphosphate hydrolase protein [Pseudovirgaria hyperparasitica]
MADGDKKAAVSAWYRKLYSRTVDLVGDYAGEEFFVVDGDSLLLEAFRNDKLDFSPGFQLLHAVHLVEKFLRSLSQRKCHFHVVFFNDQASTCVPVNCASSDCHKYQLAREVIIQHLARNSPASGSEIELHRFESVRSRAFEQYLEATGAYFFMCHDGADAPTSSAYIMRSMIMRLTQNGYNIALVNGLEFRDTKVMAMVVEGRANDNVNDIAYNSDREPAPKNNGTEVDPTTLTRLLGPLSATEEESPVSQRRLLTLAIISHMVQNDAVGKQADLISATVLHTVLLENLRLQDRQTKSVKPTKEAEDFLAVFCSHAVTLLGSSGWKSWVSETSPKADIADLFDGRIFNEATELFKNASSKVDVGSTIETCYRTFCKKLNRIQLLEVSTAGKGSGAVAPQRARKDHGAIAGVLPFYNAVFDPHLKPVSIVADTAQSEASPSVSDRIFKELSHWHNSKVPMNVKLVAEQTERQKQRALRRNQLFMAEIQSYAASLTNSAGGRLEPETVFVKAGEKVPKKANKPESRQTPGKMGAVSKNTVRADAAAAHQQSIEKSQARLFANWETKRQELAHDPSLTSRYLKAGKYLATRPKDQRPVVEASIRAYQIQCLWQIYVDLCKAGKENDRLSVAALIYNNFGLLSKVKQGITEDIIEFVSAISQVLGLADLGLAKLKMESQNKAKTGFLSTHNINSESKLGLGATEFQLMHTGPYLDRNMGSAPDDRVQDFEPDEWQRRVLDAIDERKSLLVVAPTSAGKTFISFYAMKQVLEEDDDGVLVYVAPTKALVNQIAAEVVARFKKSSFKHAGGKSVWAIHTRDHRINNPTGCQVLVTVPHILQIMLLAPSNAKGWSQRVKSIIFDEVHCIGQAEDGIVWEQLLLMAPCPIIALSATVGNPKEFHGWLQSTQDANKREVAYIEHRHRYSDLRKYIYNAPQQFDFRGFEEKPLVTISPLGLDGARGLAYMHPISSIVNRSRGMPSDLTLEARDCWFLWKAMSKFANSEYPVSSELDPVNALPSYVRKADIIEWEVKLKGLLKKWIDDNESPFDKVLRELDRSVESVKSPEVQISQGPDTQSTLTKIDPNNVISSTLPLICTLRENDALPALFFNYDRGQCEAVAHHLLDTLKEQEDKWKKTSPAWKKKLTEFEAHMKAKAKQPRIAAKSKKGRDTEEGLSKADMERDRAETERSKFDFFDPEGMVDGFHLAEVKAVDPEELLKYRKQLAYRDIPAWLIDALERGIGVHHAGMNRKYRQICEVLFRTGYLQVVIATGTLALGINMPCKTVVFSGDSIYLTALNFRQAAGRAGRRGFDLLGNVIFQAVPYPKVCRLLSSRLPDLNGHFPITTTLVLRLFSLLHNSGDSRFAQDTINSILSQPRIYLGGNEARHTVLHHLRFSIEYLRRNFLLDKSGQAINFAGTASNLYFTENSAFAFHALLKAGYFHSVCKDFPKNSDTIMLQLMLVLSHLFGRHHLPASRVESIRESVKGSSASIVILPNLDEVAAKHLQDHNKQTLAIYKAYVQTYVNQHLINTPDNALPLTGMKFGGNVSASERGSGHSALPPVSSSSPFVALSGFSETDVKSIPDLCSTVRSGVFLEQAVIPYITVNDGHLNAYLYDFFKHGSTEDLERANGVRKSEVWFLLKDFSLILATIVTSFQNYLKLSPNADLDMLDITDVGDRKEEAVDDKAENIANVPDPTDTPKLNPIAAKKEEMAQIIASAAPKKKKKVADSWDDDVSDVEDDAPDSWDADSDDDGDDSGANSKKGDPEETEEERGFPSVLAAFAALQKEFDAKFMEMWA